MKRWIAYLSVLTLTLGSTLGCSMCCGPFDYHYPTYGGKHPRVNPTSGRVGSRLSDPNVQMTGESADSNLEPSPEPFTGSDPTTTDDDLDLDAELERIRNETDGLREEIEPPRSNGNQKIETLPAPKGPTASSLWQRRPLRTGQGWR